MQYNEIAKFVENKKHREATLKAFITTFKVKPVEAIEHLRELNKGFYTYYLNAPKSVEWYSLSMEALADVAKVVNRQVTSERLTPDKIRTANNIIDDAKHQCGCVERIRGTSNKPLGLTSKDKFTDRPINVPEAVVERLRKEGILKPTPQSVISNLRF